MFSRYNPSDIARDETDAGFGDDATATTKTTADKTKAATARAMKSGPDGDRALNNLLAHAIGDLGSDLTDLLAEYKAHGLPLKIINEMDIGATWAIKRGAKKAAVRDNLSGALPTIEDFIALFAFGRDKGADVTKSLSPWDRVSFQLYWKEVPDGLGGSKFIFDMTQLLRDLQAAGRASTREMLGL